MKSKFLAFVQTLSTTIPELFRKGLESTRRDGVRATIGKSPLIYEVLCSRFRGYYREYTVGSAAEYHSQWIGASKRMVLTAPDQSDRQKLLYELLSSRVAFDAEVLEIGHQHGDNLSYLCQKGYKKLTGLDIDPSTIETAQKRHTNTFPHIKFRIGPAEELLTEYEANHFDVVFTANTLAAIPPQSEHIFEEMARVSGQYIITMEPEQEGSESGNEFKLTYRRYNSIFRELGFEEMLHHYSPTPSTKGWDIRVFYKR
jgi:SAM-dependent methyltransferase